jgi:hypothetical protein
MVDDPAVGGESISEAGVSFNDCPVVLNTGHWQTVTSTVHNHTAGTNKFDHPEDTKFEFVCCDGKGRFFVEGCEAAMDIEGEWSYSASNPTRLRFMPPDGLDPNTADVRGKTQSYAIAMDASRNIELRGIAFHGSFLPSVRPSIRLSVRPSFFFSRPSSLPSFLRH